MANPKYTVSDKPVPVSELVATLSDGTKVKRRVPRMRACNEKDEKGKMCAGHLKRWFFFGDEVKPHWAPSDPKDLIIEPRAEIDGDPERVLRDASGKFNSQQRKRALYMLLARSQPTEQQQLWLTTVADSFLQ